ncbi:MAG: glycosyltransferase family 39 protein, partial [Candidatus Harrisonbacteria bacterium]|nr:glycosyltransferase family 39 protein [Candidatus Harrisonbacteria bacterium]
MKQRHWLIAIFIVAAALRLYNLSSGDPVNDEVFYAFRGLGMMDFDEAEHQTTPLEWHDPGTGSSAAAAYPPSLDVQCAASRNTLGKILDLLTRRCAWDGARIGTGQVPQGPPNGRWWMLFSFHDHPPLVFAVQHVFMRVFGENIFAFRLPSALLGLASVYL